MRAPCQDGVFLLCLRDFIVPGVFCVWEGSMCERPLSLGGVGGWLCVCSPRCGVPRGSASLAGERWLPAAPGWCCGPPPSSPAADNQRTGQRFCARLGRNVLVPTDVWTFTSLAFSSTLSSWALSFSERSFNFLTSDRSSASFSSLARFRR